MSLRTRVLSIDPDTPDPSALNEAGEVLRRGGLVAFAAETVYGLGADATNPQAVARIFEAKGRPSNNPLIVHADSMAMVRRCVSDWPACAERLAHLFWPGPLTLLLPRAAMIPDMVTAGGGSVGVRIPATTVARELIRATGRPVAAPSANRSTGISPTEAWHVRNDLEGKIDLILDSGRTQVGIESTVLDLTSAPPRVLRPGSVTREQLSEALGEPVLMLEREHHEPRTFSSPGQMAIHYAPRTPTFRIEPDGFPVFDNAARWGLISIGPSPTLPQDQRPVWHIRLAAPMEAEARLYAALHALDARRLEFLVISPPPAEPAWIAVRDRLWRASRPWPPAPL